jgi:hypothetical protein
MWEWLFNSLKLDFYSSTRSHEFYKFTVTEFDLCKVGEHLKGRKSLVLGEIQRLIVEATSNWVGTRIESDEGVCF